MRIVAWNCLGKFDTKIDEIKKLNADIYVIPNVKTLPITIIKNTKTLPASIIGLETTITVLEYLPKMMWNWNW